VRMDVDDHAAMVAEPLRGRRPKQSRR
jgi:hypothetical protein